MEIFITSSWKSYRFRKTKFEIFGIYANFIWNETPFIIYPEFPKRPRSVINVFQISGSKNGIDPEL